MISDELQALADGVLLSLETAGCDMRGGGERWRGLCPLCGNRDLSLNVDLGQRRLWLSCWHATCSWEALHEVLGITSSDLRLQESATPAEGVVVLSRDIEVRRIEWLISGRVPRGAITGIGGEPGLGKSTLSALYAAEGSRGEHGDPWFTLFVSAEDSPSRVITPKLIALEADRSLVGFFSIRDDVGTRVPTLPDDLTQLRAQVEATDAKLIVLDPLNAFLAGDVDSHKDQQIRRVLAPLAQLAADLNIAIVVVLHTRKERGGPAIYRLGGSVGYGGAARSVLGLGRDPNDPDGPDGAQRVLGHVKSNWGPQAPTQVYRHESAAVAINGEVFATHRLVYVGDCELDAAAVFDGPGKDDRGLDCEEAIAERLANGKRLARDVKTEVAAELGVTTKTVERAGMRLRKRGELDVLEEGLKGAKGGDRRSVWWALRDRQNGADQGRDSQGRDAPVSTRVPTLETPMFTGDSGDSSQGRDAGKDGALPCVPTLGFNGTPEETRARVEEELRRWEKPK